MDIVHIFRLQLTATETVLHRQECGSLAGIGRTDVMTICTKPHTEQAGIGWLSPSSRPLCCL